MLTILSESGDKFSQMDADADYYGFSPRPSNGNLADDYNRRFQPPTSTYLPPQPSSPPVEPEPDEEEAADESETEKKEEVWPNSDHYDA